MAEEDAVWRDLKRSRQGQAPHVATVGNISLELSTPCLIMGGRNGAGKSRLLRGLVEQLGEGGLLLDLHNLCQRALSILKSRDDFDEMKTEFEILGPNPARRDDVQRVVGREYDVVNWYALEVELADAEVAEPFRWSGEQALVPYFEVEHRGLQYSSRDMGLGEFSVHFLFWILEQYRHVDGLTILLDEPDAFLPPVGASSLLVRLLKLCLDRRWSIVLTTHSSEIISQALVEDAFVLVRLDNNGQAVALHCADDPSVADDLLTWPPARHVLFVEDESAYILTRVLVDSMDRRLSRTVEVVWGNGAGYLFELQSHLPRPPEHEIGFAYLFDGDKRGEVQPSKAKRWPALCLPTPDDPDELLKRAGADVPDLARRLNVPSRELTRFLDSQEGLDAHDWVNGLGSRYGRQVVLKALAESWVENNAFEVEPFLKMLKDDVF